MHSEPIKWWLAFTFADYVFLSYLLYLLLLFLADIRFDLGARFARRLGLQACSGQCIFFIGMASHIAYFIIGLSYYHITGSEDFFIGLLAIVDFVDVRYAIFRGKVVISVFVTLFSGLLLMPPVCGIISYRRRMGFWRWCTFGFFFGYLALAKLLTTRAEVD